MPTTFMVPCSTPSTADHSYRNQLKPWLIICQLMCCFSFVLFAQDYDWQQPHAEVLPQGDLKWAPEPYQPVFGQSRRYIDFAQGDDANPGTRTAPWKHHPWDANATGQSAACSGIHAYLFKGGVTYRGALQVAESGKAGDPIRLLRDPSWGEGEAVIAGSEQVLQWESGELPPGMPRNQTVWHADLSFTPRSVWLVEGERITRIPLARTPNWKVSNPDDVKSEWFEWDFAGTKHYGHKTTANGRELHLGIDTVNLTEDRDYYAGAKIWSEWGWVMGTPFPTGVEYVDTKRKALGFRGVWGGPSGHVIRHNRYFLEDKPHYLDAPGEFWFDRKGQGGRLYLRLPGDRDPNEAHIEVASRIHMVDAERMNHMEIAGLTFRFSNVNWDITAGPWGGKDVEAGAIRLLGSGKNIQIHHNRFEHLHRAAYMKAVNPTDAIDALVVSDNVVEQTDHGAFTLLDGGAWGKTDGPIGRIHDLKVMRNKLHTIGLRPTRYNHGHAIEIECAETLEVAGNILDRCYGSGIFVFGAKRSGLLADRPLSRLLIHHNKVIDSLLNSNDWGGIETWQGGPAYVYNNISGNPGGYWHYNFKSDYVKEQANARFGHAYYLDGAYKNYHFNNIAWGKSNDLRSPLGNTAAFQEIHSFQNTFFNNTATNFLVGSRRQAPHAGRNKYLGNIWDSISYRVFRHADPAKSQAEANAADAGRQKDAFAYETNAYSHNLFYDINKMGVFEANGRWCDAPEAFQQALVAHNSLASNLGTVEAQPLLKDAAGHDFRLAGKAGRDQGVKVFVPWSLSGVVGEWNFYPAGNNPTKLLDEHWYMTADYGKREEYPDKPYFPLTTVNMGASAFTRGPLEDWIDGALTFNGNDQYARLEHASLAVPVDEKPEHAPPPEPSSDAEWITFVPPVTMAPGKTAEVTVHLKGIPKGQFIHLDLHWIKAGNAWGGMNAYGGRQTINGPGPYTFRLIPNDKPDLQAFQLLAYTSTKGNWQTRDKLARYTVTDQEVASPASDTATVDTGPKSPAIDRSNLLIEAYFKTAPGETDGIIIEKMAQTGYALLLDNNGHITFRAASLNRTAQVTGPTVNDGQWHHLIAELDRPNQQLRLYLDGKLTTTAPGLTADDSLANTHDIHVGGSPSGHGFAGTLDFLRLAQGTLADARTTIEELYAWEFHGPFLKDFTGKLPTRGKRDAGALEAD